MKNLLLSLFVVLAVTGQAAPKKPDAPAPAAAAATSKDELDTLALKLQRAGGTGTETEVLQLLKLGREAGRPFQVAPVVKLYLNQTAAPSAAVLLLAAENAWLTADYRTAVARYKAYLKQTEAGEDASSAAAQVYQIQLDFLNDKDDAYRFMREYGDSLRQSAAARRFDAWFLNEAKERRDLVAAAKRLAAAFADKLPLEQERLYYWDHVDVTMAGLSRVPDPTEVLPPMRKVIGALRGDQRRSLKYGVYLAYLDCKANRYADFGPARAAAQAYFDAYPTAETLQAILALFFGGEGVYSETEWSKQTGAKREFFMATFDKLNEAGKTAMLKWKLSGRAVQRDLATPEQWVELAAKSPALFQNADGIPFITQTADLALVKKQAGILKGVPSRQAALINALAASDDFTGCVRALVQNDAWHLPAADFYRNIGDLWTSYKLLHKDVKDEQFAKTLVEVGLETIGATPVALLDPTAVRVWLDNAWRADEYDKSKFLAAVKSVEWVTWNERDRRNTFEGFVRGVRDWGSQMRKSKEDKAKTALSQLTALDEAVTQAFDGRSADPAKSPIPLCRAMAQAMAAARKRDGATFLKAARELYPLVWEYDTKKTPYGATALGYLLQSPEGADTSAFHAEVIADQAAQARFAFVAAAILRGHTSWQDWSVTPQEAQAEVGRLNAAFAKALLAQLDKGQFSPELFNLFRATRRGHRWQNLDGGNEVIEKMIANKTLEKTGYRPNAEIKSAACSYQWLVRSEFPRLAMKFPSESGFDDLFVEEALKTGFLDGAYWQMGTDTKHKIANVAAKVLMKFDRVPFGYGDGGAVYSREAFWDWHERALSADKAERDAFVVWLDQQAGKGRFDDYAFGRAWLATAGATAPRQEFFARLNSHVQQAVAAPARWQVARVAAVARLAKADDLGVSERETLRRVLTDCAPAVWWNGNGYDDLAMLLVKPVAGREAQSLPLIPQLWRIARNTGNGNLQRALAQLGDAQVKVKQYEMASAISAAGLEIMGAELPTDLRTTLATVRSQSLLNIGGAIPVDRDDPRYPIFAAQASYNAGSSQNAWELYAANADKVPGLIKELDPKFVIWLINQNARNQQFDQAEALARQLVPWLEGAGAAVDAETRGRLLLAYAGIAFERREYPKARALFERIVTAEEFGETHAKEEAELKIAEVDRLNKQFDKAFELLDRLTRRKDKAIQTEAFHQLARLKYEQEEYPDARKFLDQVFLRAPDHAESRILEGNLDLKMKRLIEATEVKVGLTTSQRLIVPGRPLKVRLEDQNLATVGKADSIEIRAWTDSGDEEFFNLVPFGDSKTKFEGSIGTALAKTVKGDKLVQVLGDDVVHYDFSDRFKKSHNITSEPFALTVATDSELYASSGRILTKEEIAERQMEDMLRERLKVAKEAPEAKNALSLVRPPDQIKPGNRINVRVIDPDRSTTAGKDTVKVRVTATSGDVIGGFELVETDTHSGVFEGAVPTAAAQAMALASNSEEGKLPNFPISAGDHPAWVAAPDNVRPKFYTVDLHDNVPLGKLTLRSDVTGRRLRKFTFQTSLNGKEFTTLASYPEAHKPWEGQLNLTVVKADAKSRAGTAADCRAAIQQVARPYQTPVGSLAVNLEQYLAGAGLGANDGYIAHLRGAFYLDTRQVRSFRFNATGDTTTRFFFMIDGEAATAPPAGRGAAVEPAELRRSFAKGVHRLDVYITGVNKSAKFDMQWDIDKEPFFAVCPVDVFDPVKHPEIKMEVTVPPATVTAAGNGAAFDFAFAPEARARVIRFILEDFDGDAPAISRIELNDATGKKVLPTEQDLTTLKNNQILEIIPGDKIAITYEDPKVVTAGRNVHQAQLAATYMNATINACFAELDKAGGGERRASYVPVRRFSAGDPIAVVISDPDMDTTEKQDVVKFTAKTTGGKPVTLDALETEAHSGVFVGNIFPVKGAPQRATELQVKEADDIAVAYLDPENTDPGVPWERSDSIEQAMYVTPQLRVYDVHSTEGGAAEEAVAGKAKGKGASKGAAKSTTSAAETLGDEFFPASRSLVATRPKEVAGAKPAAALLDGPVFVEVLFPSIALSGQSKTTVYVQTSAGRKKAGKTDADPFDINVPGTLKLVAGCGEAGKAGVPPGYKELIVRGDPNAVNALDDGRFTFSVPIKLGETPAATLVTEEGVRTRETPSLLLKGGDEVYVGYEFTDKAGQKQWLTARVQLGSDAFLDVMDRKYMEELTGAHVGENIYVRVVDKSKHITPDKDEVTVTVTTSSGQKRTAKLSETFGDSGIFKGYLSLVHAQEQSDTNNAVAMPVQYGDTVTLSYATTETAKPIARSVLVYKGADGDVLPFTKRFKDPEIAVQTQFTIAESFFELAKKHRELGEESLSRREIAQGKKVLEEVLRDYPDTSAKAQADYLLANLALEFANIAVDEATKKKHYMEAVGRFTDIVATYSDSPYAPKSQFKKALTFEKMGEIDQACEEYVKLSYRYPDNELVAETIARLGQYFFTKAKIINDKIAAESDKLAQEKLRMDAQNMFKTAAEVFGRLAVRFPAHSLAAKSTVLSAQCYMRAEDFGKAVQVFKVVTEDVNADKEARAEAMYWCGDAYMKLGGATAKGGAKVEGDPMVEAYRMFKRLTWDYPESKWAKFARGRLTEPALAGAAKGDQ